MTTDEEGLDGGYSISVPCPAMTMRWDDTHTTRVWGCRLDVGHRGKHEMAPSSWQQAELLKSDPEWIVSPVPRGGSWWVRLRSWWRTARQRW